jgi:6-pyruvoyl-tetrahydropterin synthase
MIVREVTAEFRAYHRIAADQHPCRDLHSHIFIVKARFTSAIAGSPVNGWGEVPSSDLFGALQSHLHQHFQGVALLNENDLALAEEIGREGGSVRFLPYNPTLENIARFLACVIVPSLPVAEAMLISLSVQHSTSDTETPAMAIWLADLDA